MKVYFFFFAADLSSAEASGAFIGSVASTFGSSFFSSISVVISSIGFGGGVVAIVQPIHAPMNKDSYESDKDWDSDEPESDICR